MSNFVAEMEKCHPYLEFLRYCLDDNTPLPSSTANIEWTELYDFAVKQTAEATFWHGIQRMDRENGVKLSDVQVLAWMARREKIARRNKMVNEKVVWVWNNFRREGFRSCLLKGQGNGLFYPEPLMRTSGDIDIWVEGGDKKVIAYVDSIQPGFKRVYHHIEFRKAGKVGVEVHYRPSWSSNPIYNLRLQRWFESHADACFSNKNDALRCCVPTDEFNQVYLLSHLYCHLIREGVGLRHIIDYYHLLKKSTSHVTPDTISHLGLGKVAGAVMWVMEEILGLDKAFLIYQPNPKLGQLLLREIMRGGNFGKYDDRLLSGETKSKPKHNLQVLVRDVRLVRYFPEECLWEPWFRLWHFFWRIRH